MSIEEQFKDKSVAEIEAQIEKDVNIRDAMNLDLLALNRLRDSKVRNERRAAAVETFQRDHGFHPDQPPAQVIEAGSIAADGQQGKTGFWDRLFPKGK